MISEQISQESNTDNEYEREADFSLAHGPEESEYKGLSMIESKEEEHRGERVGVGKDKAPGISGVNQQHLGGKAWCNWEVQYDS